MEEISRGTMLNWKWLRNCSKDGVLISKSSIIMFEDAWNVKEIEKEEENNKMNTKETERYIA